MLKRPRVFTGLSLCKFVSLNYDSKRRIGEGKICMEFKIRSILVLCKSILINLNLSWLILPACSRVGKGCSEIDTVQTHVENHFLQPAGVQSAPLRASAGASDDPNDLLPMSSSE